MRRRCHIVILICITLSVSGCATTREKEFLTHYKRGVYFEKEADISGALEEYKKAETYLPDVNVKKYERRIEDFKERLDFLECWVGEKIVEEAEEFIKTGEYDRAEKSLREARLLLEGNESARHRDSFGIGLGKGFWGTLGAVFLFGLSGNIGTLFPQEIETDSLLDRLLKLEKKVKEERSHAPPRPVVEELLVTEVSPSPTQGTITEKSSQEVTNSIGMKFVLIKAGTFMMGSPDNEQGRYKDETQHKVTITKDFWLQTTEVTQGQYEEIIGKKPSKWKGKDIAVGNVTWKEAVKFCQRLSKKEGRKYRLPTEAEWEYACKAGSTTRFYFGDDARRLEEYAWDFKSWRYRTHDVGQKKPNLWGLYDMIGNVHEWCSDWYDDYPEGEVTNPVGTDTGKYRALRSSSWGDNPDYSRCARRFRYEPDFRGRAIGFRCAMNP